MRYSRGTRGDFVRSFFVLAASAAGLVSRRNHVVGTRIALVRADARLIGAAGLIRTCAAYPLASSLVCHDQLCAGIHRICRRVLGVGGCGLNVAILWRHAHWYRARTSAHISAPSGLVGGSGFRCDVQTDKQHGYPPHPEQRGFTRKSDKHLTVLSGLT